MALILEYLDLHQKYTKLYGDRVVLLMQIGKFYEMYEYDPNNCATTNQRISKHKPNKIYDQKIGKAIEAGTVLECEITFQNKNAPYSIRNPNKAGFPMVSYHKNRKILLRHNFVVIRVDQLDPDQPIQGNSQDLIRAGSVMRKVAEISSPATEINLAPLPTATNNLISIYIEYQKGSRSREDFVLTCGLSSIDITTGECKATELYSKEGDNIHALQEIYRFLLTEQPREVIINIVDLPTDQIGENPCFGPYAKFLRDRLELDQYPNLVIRCNQVNPTYLKLDYQRQFFQKVFFQEISPDLVVDSGDLTLMIKSAPRVKNNTTLGNVLLQLGLEMMMYGRISLLLLLQHCHEHGEKTIQNIKLPKINWIDSDRNLILTYNAIKQLNLTPNLKLTKSGGIRSLLDVINLTSTRLGFRMLQQRLLNPVTNPEELNWYYDMTDEMRTLRMKEDNTSLLESIEIDLRGLPDIERYQRKMSLAEIKPKELVILYRSYIKIAQLYLKVYQSGGENLKKLLLSEDQAASFNQFLQRLNSLFDIDRLESCSIIKTENKQELLDFPVNPLKAGNDQELAQVQENLAAYQENLDRICTHLNTFVSTRKGNEITYLQKPGKGKKNRLTGSTIIVTKAKANKLEEQLSKIDSDLCGRLEFIPLNSKMIVNSPIIQKLTSGVDEFKIQLRSRLLNIYLEFITESIHDYHFYQPLAKFVATIDFIKSGAKTSLKYKYYRPIINQKENSCLEVKGVRHPIIERIIDFPYVPNDLRLGSNSIHGLLLYGANSTGKSSLAKAVGLMIVMAQAGLYTAGQLEYHPYHKIITRLSGHDDLIRGQSSFVVEMEELRIILRNADNKTLVLGDELCRGTETQSGTGLTVATLEELIRRQSSFIFSTHMHHLSNMEEILKLKDKLRICHLSIHYDSKMEDLVIDRRLQDGSGGTTYGIEIAKSMGLNSAFIKRASEVRRKFGKESDQILSTQPCRYNRKVYKTGCLLCGAELEVDTHHLEEQYKADQNGLIGHVPKNIPSNLVNLCRKCHQMVHKERISLKNQETVNGSAITIGIKSHSEL